jgi:predicted nucleic acid-binding protein
MTIKRYVLDASVVAKWFLDDEESVVAAEEVLEDLLAGDIEAHAPVILPYEVGHVLSKAQRKSRREMEAEKTRRAYERFCGLPVRYHELNDSEKREALELAIRFRRSFYDAVYILLAMKLDCRWLTAEKRYDGPMPQGFPRHHIETL